MAAAQASAAQPDPTFRVTLDRGPCFGTCPSYAVSLDWKGRVTFVGRPPGRGDGSPACLGNHSWHVAPMAESRLKALIDRSSFFNFKRAYRANITDLPQFTVTVTRRGRTHSVIDHAGQLVGMPRAMSAIENAIDVAATPRAGMPGPPPTG